MKPFVLWCLSINERREILQNIENSEWSCLKKIIQRIFKTGRVPPDMDETYMVLVTKPNKGFRGIVIVDTVWTIIAYIIKYRLQSVIEFHPSVHGFLKEKGLVQQ